MPFDLVCAFPGTSLDSIWQQYEAEYFNPQSWKYPYPEQWRPCPLDSCIKRFEVSSWGRVRNETTKKILKPFRVRPQKTQYAKVYLGKRTKGYVSEYIHRLVLLAFRGPAPVGKETCHWNDVGVDNRIGNLRWDSRRNNKNDDKFTGEDRKLVSVAPLSRMDGQWTCDSPCKPATKRISDFSLQRWRANDRHHKPLSDISWKVLEIQLEILAEEVSQNQPRRNAVSHYIDQMRADGSRNKIRTGLTEAGCATLLVPTSKTGLL